MNKLTLMIGALAMLALVGCSESSVDADSDTQGIEFRDNGIGSDYRGPVQMKKTGDMLQDKPLTVIDFTEESAQSIDGLSSEGVSYTYTVGGTSSTAGRYGTSGAGTGDYYAPPMFESNGNGVLCVTFDKPTQYVSMALILSTTVSTTGGFTVDVYGPNGKLRGSYDVDTEPAPFWSSAEFEYDKNAVKKVCITKNANNAGEYAVDNITFHAGDDDDDDDDDDE